MTDVMPADKWQAWLTHIVSTGLPLRHSAEVNFAPAGRGWGVLWTLNGKSVWLSSEDTRRWCEAIRRQFRYLPRFTPAQRELCDRLFEMHSDLANLAGDCEALQAHRVLPPKFSSPTKREVRHGME